MSAVELVEAPKVGARPYSRIRGAEPSVTTILGMLPKPGLPWGAAKETAAFAVLHPDKWQHLPEAEAIDVLRKHHRGIWDGRAAMGTHVVHGVNDMFCAGLELDAAAIERIVDQTIEEDRMARVWAERDRTDLMEECFGYVLGVEQWWADFRPTNVRSEVVVRWPGLFIGSTDLRCEIDGEDWLWDLKSTAKQDDGDGVYADSWTLQLAMYGMARETVSYALQEDPKLKSGWRTVETGTGPWTPPQRYGVIHLRGDERYTPYEMNVTREVQRTAIRLSRAYAGWKSIPENPQIIRREALA